MAQMRSPPRKSLSFILPFTSKMTIKSRTWVRQLNKTIFKSSRRMLKLRIDRSIICIASVNGSVVQSEAYSVSSDIHHFVEPISPQWPAREPLCQRHGWRAKLSVSSSTVSRVFTNWPSKIDSKRTFWVLALCQRESDARQFTLSIATLDRR